MASSDAVDVELTDDERLLLLSGVMEYGGPAKGAPVLAPTVGATSVDEFNQLTDRLYAAIRAEEPMPPLDWVRALALTEICWASDVLGAASDFTTNMSDARALAALRSLQRKIVDGGNIGLFLDNAVVPRTH
jgi:hypothetical protein